MNGTQQRNLLICRDAGKYANKTRAGEAAIYKIVYRINKPEAIADAAP